MIPGINPFGIAAVAFALGLAIGGCIVALVQWLAL
jgi:hypothetical protein